MSSFDFNFGELIDEASERAGLNPSSLTHAHLDSINRSMRLLLIELEREGATGEFRQETRAYTIAAGDGGVILDADIIDVDQVAIVIAGKPTPLARSHRNDFLNLSNPNQQGQPNIYFLAKSDITGDFAIPANVLVPPAGPSTPVLIVWPQVQLIGFPSTQIQATCIRQHRTPSLVTDELDARRSWIPTMTAGLAFHLSRKWNPDVEDKRKMEYTDEVLMMKAEENHHPVSIGWRAFGSSRPRRH